MDDKFNHIAYICDDNYVLPTIVSIQSLVDAVKGSNNKYFVHICAIHLKSENIELLNSLRSEKVYVDVKFIDIHKYLDKLEKINRKTHVSSSALIKFELANIFSGLDRILYLDSDVIIKKKLEDIFDLDISDYYLAAVKEYWKIHNNYYDGIVTDNLYFNSGVMYLNLVKFRYENISDKLWYAKLHDYNSTDGKSFLMDQDAFNKICAKKCYYLSLIYNCDPKLTLGWADLRLISKEYHINYNNAYELFDNVVIMHYLGKKDKPWKYEHSSHGDIWLSVYKKSPVRNIKLNYIDDKQGVVELVSRFRQAIRNRGFFGCFAYFCKTRYRKIKG